MEDRKKSSTSFKYLITALISLVVCLVFAVISTVNLLNDKNNAETNVKAQADEVLSSQICKTYPDVAMCKTARDMLSKPLAQQPSSKGDPGDKGDQGVGVASFAQVNGNLLVTYTDGTTHDAGRVVGPKGDKGDKGDTGNTGSTGKAGSDGSAGSPGKDGVNGVDGAAGRGITSAIVNPQGELVISYTDNTTANLGVVRGPQGPPGKDGEPGKDGTNGTDGRGITSVTCGSDNNWIISYTSGNPDIVTGPCRVESNPNPVPNPEPSAPPTP